MPKLPDVLRVFPLEPGSPRYCVRNLTRGTVAFPNVEKRTCTCRNAEIFPTNPRCYHLEEATATEEDRLAVLKQMPIQAARAAQEASGRQVLPRIPEMPAEDVREAYGAVSIPGWSDKTEDERKAVFA